MLVKSTRITLEILGALLAGLLILGGLLIWRLGAEPLKLDFMASFLDEQLNPTTSPYRVEVGTWVLDWKGWGHVFDLTARDVVVHRVAGAGAGAGAPEDEDPVATVPWLWVRFSVPDLLSGALVPIRLTLNQPMLRIDGLSGDAAGVVLNTTSDGTSGQANGVLGPLAAIVGAIDLFPKLRLVEIRDGDVGFRALDGGAGQAFRLRATIDRQGSSLTVAANGRVEIDGAAADVRVKGTLDLARRSGDVSVSFTGLRPHWFLDPAANLPILLAAGAADMGATDMGATDTGVVPGAAIDGRVSASISGGGRIERASLALTSARMDVVVPSIDERVRELGDIAIDMRWVATDAGDGHAGDSHAGDSHTGLANGTLTIDRLDLKVDGVPGAISGAILVDEGQATVELDAAVRDFEVDRIAEFWPEGTGGNARPWVVQNLVGGVAEFATAKLTGFLPLDDPMNFVLESIGGDIRFSGVTTHYFRPLDPAVDGTGFATYTKDSFEIFVDTARLRGIQIRDTEVHLTALDTDSEQAEILLVFEGPFRDALAVLDNPRLGLAGKIGIDPNDVVGAAAAEVVFRFPLVADLDVEDLRIEAATRLTDASIPAVAAGAPLEAATIDLAITMDGFQAEGRGVILGTPVDLVVREGFGKSARGRTTEARGMVDVETLRRFGLDPEPYVDGMVDLTVSLSEAKGGLVVRGVADLRDATMALPRIRWSKPAGAAGNLRFAASVPDEGSTILTIESLVAADLAVSGSVALSPKGFPEAVRLDRFRVGESDIALSMALRDGVYQTTVTGQRLDLRPILGEDEAASADVEAKEEEPLGIALDIDAAIDTVLFPKTPPVSGFHGRIGHDGTRVTRMELAGKIGEEPVWIDYHGGPVNSRFKIGSDDAGSVLAELDILETIHGGKLDISGIVEGEGDDERTTMVLEIGDFVMRDAPLLARLLSATSPAGLGDVLQGKVVRFERLSATFTLQAGRTRIDDAMAFGSALGLTASGTLLTKTREIDLEGVVIPIYELNDFISSIPVLGEIIAGGKGEGILAADYRISGSLDRPSITVNPLTVLTPGIFKPFVRAFGDAVQRGKQEAASTESSIAPQDPGR